MFQLVVRRPRTHRFMPLKWETVLITSTRKPKVQPILCDSLGVEFPFVMPANANHFPSIDSPQIGW